MNLDTRTVLEILGIIFAAGAVYGQFKALGAELKSFREDVSENLKTFKSEFKEDISRLEKKQDRYNNLQERTHGLEVWKEEHLRNHH